MKKVIASFIFLNLFINNSILGAHKKRKADHYLEGPITRSRAKVLDVIAARQEELNQEMWESFHANNYEKMFETIKKGADVNSKSIHWQSLIVQAVANDIPYLQLKKLLSFNIDPLECWRALIKVLREKTFIYFSEYTLLLEHVQDFNLVDVTGSTALMYAVRNKYWRYIETLLTKQLNLNTQNFYTGQTALIDSVLCNNPRATKFLLMHGADPTIVDQSGKSFLTIMKQEEHKNILGAYLWYISKKSKCIDAAIPFMPLVLSKLIAQY